MKTNKMIPVVTRSLGVVALLAFPALGLFNPSAAWAQTTGCNLVSVAVTGPSGSTSPISYVNPSCNFNGAAVWNLNANPTSTSISTVQLGTGTFAIPPGAGDALTVNIYATAAPGGATETYAVYTTAVGTFNIPTASSGILTIKVFNNSAVDITSLCTITTTSFGGTAQNATGSITIKWPTSCTQPTISTSPTAQSACLGGNATFTATSSTTPVTYQWQRNGTNLTDGTVSGGGTISGSTTTALTITGVTANDFETSTTGYACKMDTTPTCPITTTVVALTQNAATSVTTQPASTNICTGSAATFSVTATGAGTLTYQWLYQAVGNSGFGPVSGATQSSYTTATLSGANNGDQYKVAVTGTCGSVTNATAATLTVISTAPSISSNPSSTSVCSGSTASFLLTAANATSYQWYRQTNGSGVFGAISGATASSYTTLATTIAANNGDNYQCVASGCVTPPATSSVVALTVVGVVISTQPTDQFVTISNNASFSVAATGSSSFTYQWRTNGVNIVDGPNSRGSGYTGSTTATLTVTNVTPQDAQLGLKGFDCLVTPTGTGAGCTAVASSKAAVIVRLVHFGFDDPTGTTTTGSDTNSGVNVSLTMSNGVTPTDYHGQVASGVAGIGRALDFSSNTAMPNGTTTGPVAGVTNSSALGFGTLSNFTATCWFNIRSGATTMTTADNPVIWDMGSNSVVTTNLNSVGLLFGTNGAVASSNSFIANLNVTNLNTAKWTNNVVLSGTWFFAAIASDGTNLGYYFGATNSASTLLTNVPVVASRVVIGSLGSLMVGNRLIDEKRSFPGWIDDLRIFAGTNTSLIENARLLALTGVTNVATTPTQNAVTLNWTYTTNAVTAMTGTVSYKVYRSTASAGPYTNIATVTVPTYVDTDPNLVVNTTYYYEILPNNTAGAGSYSSPASAIPTGCTYPTATVSGSAAICPGGSTTVQAALTGTGPWTVYWSDGTTHSGVSSSPDTYGVSPSSTTTFTVTNVTDTTGCNAPGQPGGVSTGSAVVTVNSAPSISSTTGGQAVCANTSASFTVNATGTALTYQWYKNGSVVSSGTTSTLTINPATSANAGTYQCVVSGTCSPPATNTQAVLTVNPAPVITSQPTAQVVCSGGNTSFSVAVTGSGVTYQWTKNGTAITSGTEFDGTNTATLNITSATAGDAASSPGVGSSRVDLQACKLEYSIVSPK